MTASEPRPRAFTVAFYLLLAGAVLLMTGGLLAITVGYDLMRQVAPESYSDEMVRQLVVLRRGAGVLCAVAGFGLAFLSGRTRTGDPRYRRATLGLALVIVVLVGIFQVLVGIGVIALVSLLPIIAGAVLLSTRVVTNWFNPVAEEPDA